MFNKNIFKQKDSVAEAISKIVEAEAKMEELKGQQHKIDKNKNNKIDAQDFAILRGEKKAMKKEETEQIDELTKDTLKSYVSKAIDSARAMPGYGTKDEKSKKTIRQVGISRATEKLAKEEVELDEVYDVEHMKYINTKEGDKHFEDGRATMMKHIGDEFQKVNAKRYAHNAFKENPHEKGTKEYKAWHHGADAARDEHIGGLDEAAKWRSTSEVEQQDESSHNPFSKDYKSQIPSKPGEKAGFDSKKISTGTVYSRKPPKEEPKKDKQDVAEGSVDPTHKKILDKEKNKVPRKPKDEYERKVERYLKSKYSKNKNVAEGTESGQEYHDRMHRLAAGYHGMDPQRRARMEKIPGWKDQYNQALAYAEKHPKKEEPKKEEYNFSGKLLESISIYTESQLDEMINEVLGKDATAGDWIHDFVHSDNPKFKGKSKAKRKEMALAAYYAKQRNEEVNEWIDPSVKTVDTLRGREKVKKDDVLGKGGDFKSPKVKFLPDPVDEGKRPESDTVPFVTSENKPLERVKEMARASMKKMKSEMMGKAGTSE